MGDTADGSWGSRELGGYLRREEARKMACVFIPETEHVFVGWGCCQCHGYNGLQRDYCKECGHQCCIKKPKPEDFGLCNECGVPKGMPHRGH